MVIEPIIRTGFYSLSENPCKPQDKYSDFKTEENQELFLGRVDAAGGIMRDNVRF
jgi:hypothetical protein